MKQFKFLQTTKGINTFRDFYEYLCNSDNEVDKRLASDLINLPVNEIIEQYADVWSDETIEEFRAYRSINSNWWREDEDVRAHFAGIENAPPPTEGTPHHVFYAYRAMVNYPSFSMQAQCDVNARNLFNQYLKHRVKHHFRIVADGIEIISYFE